MNKPINIQKLIKILRQETASMPEPMSLTIQKEYGNDPFLLLISCLLSLRARDTVTLPISRKLFTHARTPEKLASMPITLLETIIRPSGFYHQKARTLISVSNEIINQFGGHVPATYEQLRSIKGIGPKTANLVLGLAFKIPAICVDTHVHRLANAWGLVQTKTPQQTERALCQLVPKEDWIELNRLMVKWGQWVARKEQKHIIEKKLD